MQSPAAKDERLTPEGESQGAEKGSGHNALNPQSPGQRHGDHQITNRLGNGLIPVIPEKPQNTFGIVHRIAHAIYIEIQDDQKHRRFGQQIPFPKPYVDKRIVKTKQADAHPPKKPCGEKQQAAECLSLAFLCLRGSQIPQGRRDGVKHRIDYNVQKSPNHHIVGVQPCRRQPCKPGDQQIIRIKNSHGPDPVKHHGPYVAADFF